MRLRAPNSKKYFIEIQLWSRFMDVFYQLYICLCKYLKIGSFYKILKNCAEDKLKLPKWESPTGIGKVGMSDLMMRKF